MYFEIYVDSFLLLQFVMNIFMLYLVNGMMRQKTGWKRIFMGAFCGALFSLLPVLLPINMKIRMGLSFLLSVLVMTSVTFRIHKLCFLVRVLEKTAVSTLLLGGLSLFIVRFMPKTEDPCMGLAFVLAAVIFAFQILRSIIWRKNGEKRLCKVILYGEREVAVEALVDTGNSLTEPVSGKPVSVLDRGVFEGLYYERPEYFRIIPYHSIGRRKGILQGYLLPKMIVETEDSRKEYKEVYVGISDEILTRTENYKMILNPAVME